MRVLRSSFYSRSGQPPIMGVVPDSNARDTLEALAVQTVEAMAPHGLVINEIFEMENADTETATLRAVARTKETGQREYHQVVLYFWLVEMFQKGRDGAEIVSDQRAPLTPSQIQEVLEQVAKRPDYRDFIYSIPAQDGTIVTLKHGRVDY